MLPASNAIWASFPTCLHLDMHTIIYVHIRTHTHVFGWDLNTPILNAIVIVNNRGGKNQDHIFLPPAIHHWGKKPRSYFLPPPSLVINAIIQGSKGWVRSLVPCYTVSIQWQSILTLIFANSLSIISSDMLSNNPSVATRIISPSFTVKELLEADSGLKIKTRKINDIYC